MQIIGQVETHSPGISNKIFFSMWFSKIHLYAELSITEWTYLHNNSGGILDKVVSMKLQWVSKIKKLLKSERI